MDGELLRLADLEHGRVLDFENVFGCGNAVTGKGNLVASRRHASHVASYVLEQLDLPPAGAEATDEVLRRVRERQEVVGYPGEYRTWIERVAPPERASH